MSTDHPKRIGEYDVLGKLGQGGMGAVYKAVQPSLNRIVAIKILSEELEDDTSVERFKREAKAVAMLNHPNVVQIIEMSEDDGHPYFVMEYVKGTSLDAIMRQRRLSLVEAVSVFKEVCKGLQAAHRQNIVHRDLNPRNILVSEDLAMVKLADFGISRVESISRTEGTLSTGNIAMGTLHYMAPEQSSGMADVDHRADIYSLGVLLYEMLTGRVPVGRFNLPSQIEETVPPEIDPLVLRCLSADPGDRYPTVDRVVEAVTKLEDQLRLSFAQDFKGLSRTTSKLWSRSTDNLRRRPVYLIGAVVLVMVVGGLSFLVNRMGSTAVPTPRGEVIVVEGVERFSRPEGLGVKAALSEIPLPEGEESPEEVAAAAASVQPAPTRSSPPAAKSTAAVEASASGATQLEAALRKAEAGLIDQALADFNQLIASAPKTIAASALFERAKLQEKEGQAAEAMASLIELDTGFPQAAEAAEGQFRLGKLLRAQGKSRLPAARTAFSKVVMSYPRSAWVPAALAHRAAIEKELKLTERDAVLGRQVPADLISLRLLVERFPTDRAAEGGAWTLAEMYSDLGLHAEAAATYVKLGESFPKTRRDVWWEAGQLFEEKLSDKAAAVGAYQRVPESSRNYNKAQKRARKLSG
jgi:TolA-binding protein